MTNEKLLAILDFYETRIDRFPFSGTREFVKIRDMIPKMREMIADGRREKVMRWLGFIQGVFWSIEEFTLEELKAHNKPAEAEDG